MADPSPDNEAIYEALFRTATTTPSPFWATVSRRLVSYDKVELQPALFQSQLREDYRFPPKLPPVIIFHCIFTIYTKEEDVSKPTSTRMNIALRTLRDSLVPGPFDEEQQTLGGLVTHARINGTVLIGEGTSDGQSISIVPIEILVTV